MTIRRLFGTLLALCVAAGRGRCSRHGPAGPDRERAHAGRARPRDVLRPLRPDAPELERPHADGPPVRHHRRPALPPLLRRDPRHPQRRRAAPARLRLSLLGPRPGAGRRPACSYGPPRSAAGPDARRAHFAPQEFAAPRRSRPRALSRQTTSPADRGGASTAHRRGRHEHACIVDAAYHRQKGTIMAAIERFTALVDARTARRSDELHGRTDRLLAVQTLTLVLLGLVRRRAVRARRALDRAAAARLTAVTRRIAHGDWSPRAPTAGRRRADPAAGDFNEMADAVEHDLAGRRRAEARGARTPSSACRRSPTASPARSSSSMSTPTAARALRQPPGSSTGRGNQDVDFPLVRARRAAPTTAATGWTPCRAARAGGAVGHEYRIHTPTAGRLDAGAGADGQTDGGGRAVRLRRRRHRAQGAGGRPAQRARGRRGRRPREVARSWR